MADEITKVETLESQQHIDDMNQSMELYDQTIDACVKAVKEAYTSIADKIELVKHMAVTDTNEGLAKKEVNEIKNEIKTFKTFRLRFKNETMAHMKPLEDACKDIEAEAEAELTQVQTEINEIMEQRHEEQLKKARGWVKEIGEELGASDEMFDAIEERKEWGNVSAKQKDVKADIEAQFRDLMAEEQRKQERLGLLQSIIDTENENLQTKLTLDMFQSLIDGGAEDSEVVSEIKSRAAIIREAESKPKVEPKKVAEEVEVETPVKTDEEVVNFGDESLEVVEDDIPAFGDDFDDDFDDTAMPSGAENARTSFFIEVFDSDTRTDEVLRVLAENGFLARAVRD